MSPMLPKHLMSEEDIKFQCITPAITVKWSKDKITMETKITDGRINLKGNFAFRETPKRVDYLLYLNANNPIAVVEAKDNTHSVCIRLAAGDDVCAECSICRLRISSNGDGFADTIS